jgi:hypothetical protein
MKSPLLYLCRVIVLAHPNRARGVEMRGQAHLRAQTWVIGSRIGEAEKIKSGVITRSIVSGTKSNGATKQLLNREAETAGEDRSRNDIPQAKK